jgi:hypothetical protein
MSEEMIIALVAAIGGVLASSGMWGYVQGRNKTHTAQARLLMGLAYDKIVTLGMAFIQRGYVTKDEYEEYLKYLVEPYKDMGGNGVAERIAKDVGRLPFRTVQFTQIITKEDDDDSH